MNTTIRTKEGFVRDYVDGERQGAGAMLGYAHLQPGDEISPGEDMRAFTYTWKHLPSGKTGTRMAACFDEVDFRNYLALWNSAQKGTWEYEELSSTSDDPMFESPSSMKLTMLLNESEAKSWSYAGGEFQSEHRRIARALADSSGKEVEIRARSLGKHRELLFSTKFDPQPPVACK